MLTAGGLLQVWSGHGLEGDRFAWARDGAGDSAVRLAVALLLLAALALTLETRGMYWLLSALP